MATTYLVEIGQHTFIYPDAHKPLTCGMVNPAVFSRYAVNPTGSNQCVFSFFGLEKTIVKRLDRRNSEFRRLALIYPYFCAIYLPLISQGTYVNPNHK